MPKKTNLELSDALIEEVGEGPSIADLPSEAEIDELFDLNDGYCDECGELLGEDGECEFCYPTVDRYEPFEDEIWTDDDA